MVTTTQFWSIGAASFAALSVGCGAAHAPADPSANASAQTSSIYGDGPARASDGSPRPIKERLPPPVIQRVVRADFDDMRKCYEAGLARDPKLEGKITVRFVIERDGSVSTPHDVEDSWRKGGAQATPSVHLTDRGVIDCILARFAALKFPKPDGDTVTVVYPIIFAPETASQARSASTKD